VIITKNEEFHLCLYSAIIARTHENEPNPRFVDTEILDFRTNARKVSKSE
jgi:hypothetical protein